MEKQRQKKERERVKNGDRIGKVKIERNRESKKERQKWKRWDRKKQRERKRGGSKK